MPAPKPPPEIAAVIPSIFIYSSIRCPTLSQATTISQATGAVKNVKSVPSPVSPVPAVVPRSNLNILDMPEQNPFKKMTFIDIRMV